MIDMREALEELRSVLTTMEISHSRMRPWCGVNIINVYAFDVGSPSGFVLAASIVECDEANEMLRGALSPLSPEEPR